MSIELIDLQHRMNMLQTMYDSLNKKYESLSEQINMLLNDVCEFKNRFHILEDSVNFFNGLNECHRECIEEDLRWLIRQLCEEYVGFKGKGLKLKSSLIALLNNKDVNHDSKS